MIGILVAIVALAHAIETMTGFGATVFALAAGSLVWPLDPLLAALIGLGWLQSAFIVTRNLRSVRARFLARRVLPGAVAGMVAGRLVYDQLPVAHLRTLLGVFVVVAAGARLWDLVRAQRRSAGATAPHARSWARLLEILPFLGGVFHGLFASGGPVIVYYTAARIADKREFRATMSALWWILNSGLLVWSAVAGSLGRAWPLAGWLLPGLAAGVVAGEWLHRTVREELFRVVVQAVLLAIGCVLIGSG